MYLVDTNVISEASPNRVTTTAVAGWMAANLAVLFMSVVTVTEITDGVARARRGGATRRADAIGDWLEVAIQLYGDRILPTTLPIARRAGELSDRARAAGHAPGLSDILIAATADHHGMTVLTRNVRDFAPLGVAFHNPFDALPVAG